MFFISLLATISKKMKIIISFSLLIIFTSCNAQVDEKKLSREILKYVDTHYYYPSKYTPLLNLTGIHPRKRISKSRNLEFIYAVEIREVGKQTSSVMEKLINSKNWDTIFKLTKYSTRKQIFYNDDQEISEVSAGVTKYIFKKRSKNIYECEYFESDKLYSKFLFEYYEEDLLRRFITYNKDGKIKSSKEYIFNSLGILTQINSFDDRWESNCFTLNFTYNSNTVNVKKKNKYSIEYRKFIEFSMQKNKYKIIRYDIDRSRIDSEISFEVNDNSFIINREVVSRNYIVPNENRQMMDYGKVIKTLETKYNGQNYNLTRLSKSNIDNEISEEIESVFFNKYGDLTLWIDDYKNKGATGAYVYFYKYKE